jgi:hypothetical protein
MEECECVTATQSPVSPLLLILLLLPPAPFFPEQLLFLLQKLLLSPLGLTAILLDVVYSESQGSKYGRCLYKCNLTYYCRVLL